MIQTVMLLMVYKIKRSSGGMLTNYSLVIKVVETSLFAHKRKGCLIINQLLSFCTGNNSISKISFKTQTILQALFLRTNNIKYRCIQAHTKLK